LTPVSTQRSKPRARQSSQILGAENPTANVFSKVKNAIASAPRVSNLALVAA